jgi:hypothetical protein
MKERPILFNGPMVRALLDGSKTQTRRVMKPQPVRIGDSTILQWRDGLFQPERMPANSNLLNYCPYGQPGDRLWVRETHAQVLEVDIPAGRPTGPIGTAGSPARPDWKSRYVYLADGPMPNVQWHHIGDSQPVRWTPSIHMPRRASRILLEIVSVRVERLQDIREADARAEGVTLEDRHMSGYCAGEFLPPAIRAYRELWESISGAGSWDANPWVWCISFRRVAP